MQSNLRLALSASILLSGAAASAASDPASTPPPGPTPNSGQSATPSADFQPGPGYAPHEDQELDHTRELRGVFINAAVGVEGYTGALAPRIKLGETYGVNIAFRPSKVLGFELAYSGSVNQINTAYYPAAQTNDGADIVRNGGSLIVTLGLTVTEVNPYILAGVAVNQFTVRDGQSVGFKNDTAEAIPVGAGLRAQFGHFISDLRFAYSLPVGQDFAPGVVGQSLLGLNSNNSGRYQVTIGLGAKL